MSEWRELSEGLVYPGQGVTGGWGGHDVLGERGLRVGRGVRSLLLGVCVYTVGVHAYWISLVRAGCFVVVVAFGMRLGRGRPGQDR